MKRRLLCSTIVALGVTASSVNAQDFSLQDWSVSILGGHSFYPSLSYDGGKADIRQGLNAGMRLEYGLDNWIPLSGFSLQGDVFYTQSDLRAQTQARFDSLSYMGNLVYHVDTGTPFGAYGGAGIGAIRTEIGDPLSDRNSTVPGWQALGGLDYQFTPEANLFVEYRYQNAHDANLRFIGGPVGNTSNNASVGIKVGL